METNPSSSNVLGLPGQSIERTLIVAEDDIPFETLTDFVIQTTRREEQDDGFYIMNMERTISTYNKVRVLARHCISQYRSDAHIVYITYNSRCFKNTKKFYIEDGEILLRMP
ncbi:uncharacterized protein LOC110251109 [Exaiptasia diaphana]|uniref:Uncharacterized protein n=1 Tax=Exaiptasia diaphana TaxID=2652724 RepID=A0A913YX09_EXADI|nr:uncharacterized protein LOC110251109 [Exaiptasia diaphana]